MARRRLTAWTACLGFGASLVLAHLHLADTVHGFCSDHGELIHLPPEGTHDTSPPIGAATVRTHVQVAGDHGCSLLEFLVTPTTTQAAVASAGARPERCPPRPKADPEADRPISLLRQAPKLSPPLA